MRGQFILLNLLWICEFRFKCSMSSLAVVFFLRRFLWGLLAFRIIVENVCKPFTLFHSKWETKLRYQGQLNHPIPIGWRKNYYVVFYPMCLGRAFIQRSLRLWKERGYAILSFYLRWFVIFQWLLHKDIITQTSIHLNIHSLLRMLQYLWHGRVHSGIYRFKICPNSDHSLPDFR